MELYGVNKTKEKVIKILTGDLEILLSHLKVALVLVVGHDLPAHELGQVLEQFEDLVAAFVVLGQDAEVLGDEPVQGQEVLRVVARRLFLQIRLGLEGASDDGWRGLHLERATVLGRLVSS